MGDILFQDADALTDFLENIATEAIGGVGKAITEIVKENVRTIVYDPYESFVEARGWYERQGENGGFLGSWRYDVSFGAGGDVQVLVFSDPTLMLLAPPIHGQSFEDDQDIDIFISTLNKMGGSGEGDRRPYMDKAIAEGSHYDFYVSSDSPSYLGAVDNWWTRPRDYFSPSLRKIDREKSVEKSVEASLRKNNPGIKIKKVVV